MIQFCNFSLLIFHFLSTLVVYAPLMKISTSFDIFRLFLFSSIGMGQLSVGRDFEIICFLIQVSPFLSTHNLVQVLIELIEKKTCSSEYEVPVSTGWSNT